MLIVLCSPKLEDMATNIIVLFCFVDVIYFLT